MNRIFNLLTAGTITSGSGANLMLTLRNKTRWLEADAKLICDLSPAIHRIKKINLHRAPFSGILSS